MSHLLLNVLSILWQMPRILMYYNDWFYICKDLMEGKINYNYNYNYKTPRTNYPVTQGHISHDIIVQQNCLFAQDMFTHCTVISVHTQVWQTSPYTGMTNFTKLQTVLDASSTWTSITTISTSWFYLYMDIWEIKKWMNEWMKTSSPVIVNHVPLDDLPATLLA
jgi:hypothetical protein